MQESDAWQALASGYAGEDGGIVELAAAVKEQAASLERMPRNATHSEPCATNSPTVRWPRSSSPEEDLAGASFAGLYETVLNVEAADLEDAVRRCFLSCPTAACSPTS